MRINRSGNFVVRGQTTENDGPARINLFDGTYKSGFRIVSFMIAAEETNASSETQAKVTTEESQYDGNIWHWELPTEVAWTSTNMFADGAREPPFMAVDSSVILVEDLYVYVHNNTAPGFRVNYMIELQPVDLKAYEYALSYVQNNSQG